MSQNTDTDAIKRDVESLRKDLRELAEGFRQSGENQARRVGKQAQDTYETYAKEARKRGKEVGAEIEARPFTSVIAAFVIGLILGKIFR
ncbi:hypothetical protein [Salinisphaera sp. Q1T1-3]|uniref:hypothetical protein n=1 Tax=Salinisphaera sp. Q1T1-3 TaxID=2321229 RepID=UPI000E73F5F7|nr:hypothetical protein [Salinisphaera sp. Q1T1-3]RJS94661.1 hypothetical protein D3260_02475 [Salinisphaera sp. Q1T1-3]